MRRAVTFSLVVLTVFLWAASLWRLSVRVTGMDLVCAGIPAALALLLLIGFAVSGRILIPTTMFGGFSLPSSPSRSF